MPTATAGSSGPRTERVSVSSSGAQAKRESRGPSVSRTGRFVAFTSSDRHLARGDRDHEWDVFVRDLKRNTTTLVSIQRRGKHGGTEPSISADGRSVAFVGTRDVYVRHLATHKTERVTFGQTGSGRYISSITPALSGDGTRVAFTVNEEFTSPIPSSGTDVFVRDLKTRRTQQVSVSPHTRQTTGFSFKPTISADGRFVAFVSVVDLITGDRNGAAGVYRRNLAKHTTERVNVNSNGETGDNGGFNTAISANGRFVAFDSYATNLVPDDTNQAEDVFVRDVVGGTTTRVSVSDSGEQAESSNGQSYEAGSENPAISGDGRFVAFQSRAPNLVPDDTNGVTDVFVRGPLRP